MNTYYKKDIPEHLQQYFQPAELGLEPTFQEYIIKLCNIFDEVKRVLRKDGTCWVNMGDTYMGNSSYSEKGRQGLGNDKIGMINKKQWLDPKYPHKERLRAREHIENGQIIEKSLCQIPSRFAIEMSSRGWILRNEIIWHKPNCMPSSVKDRFTVDFEKVFFFVKNKKYWFETQYEALAEITQKRLKSGKWESKQDSKINKGILPMNADSFNKAIKKMEELGARNKRCVWKINTKPFKEAHFATYPKKLIEPMIKAGCPEQGTVLDPFLGSGTTAVACKNLKRNYIGIEISPEYCKIAEERLRQEILI